MHHLTLLGIELHLLNGSLNLLDHFVRPLLQYVREIGSWANNCGVHLDPGPVGVDGAIKFSEVFVEQPEADVASCPVVLGPDTRLKFLDRILKPFFFITTNQSTALSAESGKDQCRLNPHGKFRVAE